MQNNCYPGHQRFKEEFAEDICNRILNMIKSQQGELPANLDNGIHQPYAPLPQTEKLTLTVKEMQNMLGISRTEAYALVNQDDFPSFRIGKKILISRTGLYQWIDRQTMKNTERGAA